jgi:hypothetical protein
MIRSTFDPTARLRRLTIRNPNPMSRSVAGNGGVRTTRARRSSWSKIKAEIYADNGAPEYWIFDVRSKTVFVYTRPQDGVYTHVVRRGRGDVLRSTQLPGVALSVSKMFSGRDPLRRREPQHERRAAVGTGAVLEVAAHRACERLR